MKRLRDTLQMLRLRKRTCRFRTNHTTTLEASAKEPATGNPRSRHLSLVLGTPLAALMVIAVVAAPVAHAALPASYTCTGSCSTLGADGVVTLSPFGSAEYMYISTNGGQTGVGALPTGALGGETNGSMLTSPVFSAKAGDVLAFYFNYVTSDGAGFADYAWAAVADSAMTPGSVQYLVTARTEPSGSIIPGLEMPGVVSTLTPASVPIINGGPSWSPLGSSSGECYAGGCGYTGWVKAEYTIPAAGNYVLAFGTVNWADEAYDSGLAIDGATIGGQPIGGATLTVKSAKGDFADPTTVSATLTNTATSSPVGGKSVKFTLNGSETCTGTTNASGEASCSITPGEAAGTYTLKGEFAGDTEIGASSGSASFEVTKEETALSYTGATSAINGQPVTLSGHLTTDDPAAGTALAGKTVTFTLGEGLTAQTCTGTTDASGNASCEIASVNQTVGSVPVKANFAGDTFYVAAEASSTVSVFEPHATGAFVVGDLSAGPGKTVNFWGAQWATNNAFSGGRAPSSMKGYAASPTALTCGATWTTSTGNSSAPPATLPGTIDVIVSSKVTQKGSTISGQILHIVVVEVKPGYGPAPGHAGNGKIIGSIC